VNLGIVGDTGHVATGVSYHLGKDQLRAGAYSATLPRDKAGLSNAASACDLGKLGGSLAGLQKFSSWLVAQIRAIRRPTATSARSSTRPTGRTSSAGTTS
jgi:hypothetical protein